MKLSSKALACGQSPMRKFHPYAVAAAAAGKKIYHLNIGQPDIHTPDALYDAIHNFRTPVLAYAASPGIPELIEAIERYYRNIGVQLNESDILITTGGSEACITPKTKAIMVTNPGNPTGTCLTEAQMKMLLDVAVAHDLYLVADEVYREFTYDGEPLHSFGKFDYGQENLILIDSVSKRFSACGARIGCLISRNREFMANALKYCQARLSVATLDQIAAAALYSVGPEYFEQVRQEYKRRRDTVVRKLHEIPGVICECPRGAFYLMAALPVDDAEKFQLWLLQEFEDHGDTVMFSAGEPFYATPGKGRSEIRIAYVLKQEDLERAMDLLALGIRKYNETH